MLPTVVVCCVVNMSRPHFSSHGVAVSATASDTVNVSSSKHAHPTSSIPTLPSGRGATPIRRSGALYNKREMFFRGETPASSASSSTTAAPANSSHVTAGGTAKEAHSHANGRDKENRPETSQGSGVSRSGSTAAHTAPPASAAAADSTTTGHQPLTSAPSGGGGGKSVAAVTARLAAAAAASSGGGRRARQLDGYVGFANLPNQVYRRAVKRGFHFTMMVVGEAGLGKSTLVNSMFMTELYGSDFPGPSMRVKKTVAVEKTVVQLKETGVNLTLTIVDTPGFGDAVDNSNCWQPVIEYIEQQYESYLNAESRIHRTEPVDTRVHCCLYFIGPSGHNLKPLDVEFMRRLHDKVNIIPVIAKADTMTPEEVMHFKKQVLNEITQHKIRIYEFPDCEDEDENRAQRLLRDRVPFAVVGANTIVDVDGKKVRGRRYPWGTVQVDNMEHSDFIPLRNMLVRTHMMDMCAVTSNVHYENYRARALSINITGDSKTNRIVNKNPLAQMEEEKREHEQKIKKMEEEMQQVFEMKVKEKKNKLKDTERDINDHERHLLGQLEDQRRMLQSRRADLEKKCRDWQISMEDLRRKDDKEGVDGKKKRKGIF